MRIEEISPIIAPQQAGRAAEAHAARQKANPAPDQDLFSPTGQISVNGITAYFSVENGQKIVFELVEDATGRVIRQVSPSEMLQISGAITEMLTQEPSGEPVPKKGEM